MKKVALVTGASTGLGISISIQLAAKGYAVYATMRNLEKKSQLQEAAETASSQTIHQHRMKDMPSIPFFMPDGQGYHGAVEPAASAEFKPISVQD